MIHSELPTTVRHETSRLLLRSERTTETKQLESLREALRKKLAGSRTNHEAGSVGVLADRLHLHQ
jgi:hypothetical protein